MADLPEGQLGRAPFPAIAWVMDQPCNSRYLFQRSQSGCPRIWPCHCPLSEMVGDQAGARLLLLQPGRESQQRKLGLSWFLPQIQISPKFDRSIVGIIGAPVAEPCSAAGDAANLR